MRTKPALLLISLAPILLTLLSIVPAIFAGQNASLALRVIVIPSKTSVRSSETFGVALRVENPGKTNQTIRVMNCSWLDEWQSSNPKVSWLDWDCTKNFAFNIEIPPGGAYTNQLQMFVRKDVSDRSLKFRMGFTPIGSEKVFWSDPVKLRVTPTRSAQSPIPDSTGHGLNDISSHIFGIEGEILSADRTASLLKSITVEVIKPLPTALGYVPYEKSGENIVVHFDESLSRLGNLDISPGAIVNLRFGQIDASSSKNCVWGSNFSWLEIVHGARAHDTNTDSASLSKDSSSYSNLLELAKKQLKDAPVVFTTLHVIASAPQALPELQAITARPIDCFTEYDGWYWFSSDQFISGYAVKKGSRKILKWSVW